MDPTILKYCNYCISEEKYLVLCVGSNKLVEQLGTLYHLHTMHQWSHYLFLLIYLSKLSNHYHR